MLYQLPESALIDFLKISKKFHKAVKEISADRKQNDVDLENGGKINIESALVKNSDGWPYVAIQQLRDIVEIAVHLQRADEADYQIISIIRDRLSSDCRYENIKNTAAWLQAIKSAVEVIRCQGQDSSIRFGGRKFLVAQAFLALENQGIKFQLDGRGPYHTAKNYNLACQKIEKKIQKCGGLETANRLLSYMDKSGKVIDGSYVFARSPVSWQGKYETNMPWHFIYMLAVKNLAKKPASHNIQHDLQAMEGFARQFAASFDVEPHSQYEHISISPASFLHVLRETVQYDELFAFQQWQPIAAGFLLQAWLDCLEKAGCAFPYANKRSWQEFGNNLLNLSKVDRLVSVFVPQLLSNSVNTQTAERLIKQCSLNSSNINKKYIRPTDTTARNVVQFPILGDETVGFYVQPKALMVRAFCERLYLLMKENGVEDLDNKMGMSLELLARRVLEYFNEEASVFNKKYKGRSKGEIFEIDLAIETDDRIILIECKKKSLTNRARNGHPLLASEDYSDSFLSMATQLCRHQERLVADGKISFLDGSCLEHKGREITKIAISLFDHGSIQNKDYVLTFLDALTRSQFVSTRKTTAKQTAKINKKIRTYVTQIDGILTCCDENNMESEYRKILSSIHWFSIDQLYYLLHLFGSLSDGIRQTNWVSYRSGDMIFEWNQVRRRRHK